VSWNLEKNRLENIVIERSIYAFSSRMIPSSNSIEIGLIGKGKLARLIIIRQK
jgi:hypothetical protein